MPLIIVEYGYQANYTVKGDPAMKNIIEILGGAQMLLDFSFDLEEVFESQLTDEHRGFLTFLSSVEEYLPKIKSPKFRFGRPRYDDLPIFRAYLAKHIFQIEKNNLLRQRLLSDANLRHICGFKKVPSESTFSRRLDSFSRLHLPESTLAQMVRAYHEGMLVRVIGRDSTTIAAREKTATKKKCEEKHKRKRGRPRKNEVKEVREPKRVKKQLRQSPGKSLSELDKGCGWGKHSGVRMSWTNQRISIKLKLWSQIKAQAL